ncbi:MAG: tetratricopeptide repeat protein [Salibacteraceae bacterium]
MKTRLYSTIILCIFSLNAVSQVSNVLPMYGPGKKTEKHHAMDAKFVESVLIKYGTKQKACEAHINFAWRYLYNNDPKTAMKRFNQAWILNPKFADSFYGFSALALLEGNDSDFEKFNKMGKKYDRKNERATECYRHSANCMEQLTLPHLSVIYWSKLIELDNSESFYFEKRGFLYSSIDSSELAISDYSKAIELDPQNANTFNNRGYRYQINGNLELAIKDYSKAIEIEPKYISAKFNRALTYQMLNKPNIAILDIYDCVRLDSNHAPFYSVKGQLHLSMSQFDDACESFVKVLELGDESIRELFNSTCTETIKIKND